MNQHVKVIELDAVVRINQVSDLRAEWIEALKKFDKIEVDASAITQIDTAALQLLLILKRTAMVENKDVVIEFPSERFCEASRLLGVYELFGLDNLASGLF